MKKGTLFTSLGGLVVLVISFIAFVLPSSLGSSMAERDILTFGEYNGRKISYEQGSVFNSNLERISRNYQMYGMDPNQYNYQIFNSAFTETVKQYIAEDALNAAGFVVSDSSVNRVVKTIPQFQEDGKFSVKLYNKADPKSIQDLKNSIRQDLLISSYDEDFYGSSEKFGVTTLYGLKISEAEKKFLANFNEEKRGFDMVSFDKSSYPEEEKLNYAEKNAAKFVKLNLSVITCDDSAKADTVVARINNNELTFEDAIAEYSNNRLSDTEGNITNDFQYQVEAILEDKANIADITNLSVGSITKVIPTSNGYSIFKKKSENVQPDFTDADMLSKVSSYLYSYESTIIEDYFSAKAKDFTTAVLNSDFDAACEQFGLTKVTIAPFPLNYGSVAIADSLDPSVSDVLKSASSNETFLKNAFSLKMNECSNPIVMTDSVVVLQYTTSEEVTIEEEDIGIVKSQVGTLDVNSIDSTVLKNSKLKNDFINTYFNKMMR